MFRQLTHISLITTICKMLQYLDVGGRWEGEKKGLTNSPPGATSFDTDSQYMILEIIKRKQKFPVTSTFYSVISMKLELENHQLSICYGEYAAHVLCEQAPIQ